MINAAAAPTCGAAADVPKKLYLRSPSISSAPKSTVVFTPFGATKSGLLRCATSPVITSPPREEKDAGANSSRLYAGVARYEMAPTEIDFSAFACPTTVDDPAYPTNCGTPRKKMYLNRGAEGIPAAVAFTIMR